MAMKPNILLSTKGSKFLMGSEFRPLSPFTIAGGGPTILSSLVICQAICHLLHTHTDPLKCGPKGIQKDEVMSQQRRFFGAAYSSQSKSNACMHLI